MRHALAVSLLTMLVSFPVMAQNATAIFGQVTGIPIPLQSASGRFSSLNPRNQTDCSSRQATGRVVSPRLILAEHLSCGRPGHDNVLVNVQLANPADAAQMITGRRVTVRARFKTAEEDRDSVFVAGFLIAAEAKLMVDPRDRTAPPGQAFTSYMLCQPPELDALAEKLGQDLCVQNTILPNLPAGALEAAARMPAHLAPQDSAAGDPGAISCRLDSGVSDRQLSAIACARNSYWAWYSAKWHNPRSSTPAPP